MIKIEEFKVNTSLAYLIQQHTKDSTQEILGYFHGICSFVIEDVYKKSKARYTHKEIVLFYKDTPISYKIKIFIAGIKNDMHSNAKYQRVSIGYPSDSTQEDTKDLVNKIVESGLGLIEEEDWKQFERPELATPGCLRKVRVQQAAARTTEVKEDEKQDTGQ